MKLFEPVPASGIKLSATTTTGSAKLGGQPRTGAFSVSVYNSGAVGVLVDFGDSTITVSSGATGGGHAVPPGAVRGFTINNPEKGGDVYVAAITLSSTADVYVSVGIGI